jgi:hypothetical protein
MKITNQIPPHIWNCEIESLCVTYWFNPRELKRRINERLPEGWSFVNHCISERDSFGPVTSLLILRGNDGQLYQGSI